jgi:hypothetical protein
MKAKEFIIELKKQSKPGNPIAVAHQKHGGSKSGAHKDKTKVIPRNEKHKNKEYAESLDEVSWKGIKQGAAAAGLAGAMAFGAGSANARVTPGDDPSINRLTGKPIAAQQATDNAPAKAQAPKGFSKEYLQAVVDGKHPRPMVSVEKAKELLKNMSEGVAEAGMYTKPGRPGAYGDDYRSSVIGMRKKDSIAYQQDGGANDEGEADAPYQAAQDKPVLKGYYFYNVQPGQEDTAGMYGVKQTKSGKWGKAKYSTSGRSFDMQKDNADKEFGAGKWWALK